MFLFNYEEELERHIAETKGRAEMVADRSILWSHLYFTVQCYHQINAFR